MRKLMVVLGFIPLLALADPMMSDRPKCHGDHDQPGSEQHMKRPDGPEGFIFKELDLDDKQQAEIKTLFEQSKVQMKERFMAQHDLMRQLRQLSFSEEFDQAQADKLIMQMSDMKIEDLKQKTQTQRQIFNLLTPEQKQKLKTLAEERKK